METYYQKIIKRETSLIKLGYLKRSISKFKVELCD